MDQPDQAQTAIAISAEEMKAALEREIGNLIIRNLTLEKRIARLEISIAQLQAEIVDLNPLRATMGREAAGHAEEGRAIIRESQKSRPD